MTTRGGPRGFELFDLTVYLGPRLVPWVSAVSRLGHVHGIPRHDPALPSIDEMLDTVYDFVDAVRFAEREPDPLLSRHLGQLVFGEPAVLELFQATRGAAADRGHELLVRILASPHLAVLPWELLPDPAEGSATTDRFLALAPDAAVVRLARGRTYPVRSDPVDPPLNLLVVLSSPMGRDPADDSLAFDIYEEKRSLLAELAPLVDAGLLNVSVEEQPTLENLRRQIGSRRRGYHLVHYLGHAEPDRLILEDEHGRRRDDTQGAQFTQILRLCPDLRLAVFAGCETARAPWDPVADDAGAAEGSRSIFSIADRCVQESCPMVVGMQAVLPFRTERLFTRFFYQGIVSGYSVASAMRLARGAARADRHIGGDLLDWSVPVLFVGGSDPGPLLEQSAVGQKPEKPARHLLRLGLRQRETLFFARDVALRQAIDVLSGAARERVLIVTGPSGVGKTFLIDRALEELGGPVFVLYVKFQSLIAGLESESVETGPDSLTASGLVALKTIKPDAILEKLCGLVEELLARGDGRRLTRDPALTAEERWPWLVEDLSTRRFVLVIDNLDMLVAMERAIVQPLVPFWFAARLADLANAPVSELTDWLDEFIERMRDSEIDPDRIDTRSNPLVDGLEEFRALLGGTGINAVAKAALVEHAEVVAAELQAGDGPTRDVIKRLQDRVATEDVRNELRSDLRRLAEVRGVLDRALRRLAERRSPSRIAILAAQLPEDLLNLPSDWRFEMRLGHLTWAETWRWIHRNLPGLLRYGEEYLGRLWLRLGSELEHWEALERRVLAAPSGGPSLDVVADEIARRPSAETETPTIDRRPRGERPLRVAVAGPHLAGAEALALAFTRLAAAHAVGGRVVTGVPDTGSLAVLVNEPSPFVDGETATDADILRWILSVSKQHADVILLDYGSDLLPGSTGSADESAERQLLRTLRHRALMIAAGGNAVPGEASDAQTRPAAYPEVLAVGTLGADGRRRSYSTWTPAARKPDLFMEDNLIGTPLEEALAESVRKPDPHTVKALGQGTHGSSFAAFHAVAAAVLVWSTLPALSPRGVWHILTEAAQPIDAGVGQGPVPLKLDVAAAVAHARRVLVRQTLHGGACSLQALAAITGLDLRVVSDTIASLLALPRPQVRRLSRGRLERYELIEG